MTQGKWLSLFLHLGIIISLVIPFSSPRKTPDIAPLEIAIDMTGFLPLAIDEQASEEPAAPESVAEEVVSEIPLEPAIAAQEPAPVASPPTPLAPPPQPAPPPAVDDLPIATFDAAPAPAPAPAPVVDRQPTPPPTPPVRPRNLAPAPERAVAEAPRRVQREAPRQEERPAPRPIAQPPRQEPRQAEPTRQEPVRQEPVRPVPPSDTRRLSQVANNDNERQSRADAPRRAQAEARQNEIGRAVVAALQRHASACWIVPKGIPAIESMRVEINVTLDRSRRIVEAVAVRNERYRSDAFYRQFVDSAERSFQRAGCDTLPVPEDGYEIWRSIEFEFRGSNF